MEPVKAKAYHGFKRVVVPHCPYCGGEHSHSADAEGARMADCGGGEYELVFSDAVNVPPKLCPECKRETKPEDFDEFAGMCNECSNAIQEAENERQSRLVQVTHEMAIDAGDKRLEGQWIEW